MENNRLWKKAVRLVLSHQKPSNDNHGCRIAGPHDGPTVTVASDGEDTIRLCLHHARIWSDSDLCRDVAATGHTNAVRVLSDWISSKKDASPLATL